MVPPGQEDDGCIFPIPQAETNTKTPPLCQPRVYPEHFSSVEFVPDLPSNTKCHLFGTHRVQLSCLLHYAFNDEACQSWKALGDSSPSSVPAVLHGSEMLRGLASKRCLNRFVVYFWLHQNTRAKAPFAFVVLHRVTHLNSLHVNVCFICWVITIIILFGG